MRSSSPTSAQAARTPRAPPRERADVVAAVDRIGVDLARERDQLLLRLPLPDHQPRPAPAKLPVEVGEALEQELGPRPGGVTASSRRRSKQKTGTRRRWSSSAARRAGWSRIRRSRRSQRMPAGLKPTPGRRSGHASSFSPAYNVLEKNLYPAFMVSIGELSERTGVAAATLRMWETRHGFRRRCG